jgi:protein TonB
MKTRHLAALALVLLLSACGTGKEPEVHLSETRPDATSTATTVNGYKLALANRIAQVSSIKVFIGRPQALLRSVVVVKYSVDAQGRLLRSDILRSNRDRATERTALASLRAAAPFPETGGIAAAQRPRRSGGNLAVRHRRALPAAYDSRTADERMKQMPCANDKGMR